MKKEGKDLLLKDLCARLPYGIICEDGYGNVLELNGIDKPNSITFKCSDKTFWTTDLDKCKPYLFPLSSMTEEQKIECFKGTPLEIDKYGDVAVKDDFYGNSQYTDLEIYLEVIDWLNKNHFDYRGLIARCLAIDATGLNIYKEETI